MARTKQQHLLVSTVKFTIYGHGRGWCFTLNDFAGLNNDVAVRQALSRLDKAKFIRRISWGLYEYPRKHPRLGILPPDISQVVKAIARKDQIAVLPSGAYAANLLGLSEQVPGKVVYLTEGLSKRVKIGKTEIIFKKTTPKNMASAGTVGGLVIQALKYLGRSHSDETIISTLKKRLSKRDNATLRKSAKFAPRWIAIIINQLTEDT